MNKKTKWILISIGILLVLLVVLSKAGVFGKDEGLKVTAEKVQRRTIIEVVNASGKVYPEIEVKVSPDISGEITELTVQEGDTVKKGQLLARIYADIYSLQRDQAASGVAQSQAQVATSRAQVANSEASLGALKATLDQAQKNFNMQKKLYDDKVISLSEFNIAEASYKTSLANYNAAVAAIKGTQASVQGAQANVQSAVTNLQKANKDLGRTAVIAPMNGVVSLLSVKKGERVVGSNMMAGTEILRIADMASIEIRVDVGENDVPKVKLGDSAVIDIDAYSNRKFKGIVTQIASSNNGAASQSAIANATNDVTQYKVYIRLLPESYSDLLGKGTFPFRPGMSASADIQTRRQSNVLSVPINAVTTRDKYDTVLVDKTKTVDASAAATTSVDDLDVVVFVKGKDDKVQKVNVSTGIQDINYIEITQGLKEGDEVITGPYDVVSKTLKKDARVKVVDKKELFEKKK
ncbi:MAG TPA: efflux RND transporter periplasmic adaptor subunit [Ferruginibacter sp.]|nr:efflux RND transporter periplasmic adaptor subunit [Ferruginibacter sp.]